jgi:hypothetical protein
VGCDPLNAASVPADHIFQTGWVQHVRTSFGAPNAGGLKFWGFDNEPSIWHNVYWDVHPHGAHDTEMRDKMIAYGAMIKGVDPTIQTLGPEEWGWDGYFYSGADQESTNRNLQSLRPAPRMPRSRWSGDYGVPVARSVRGLASAASSTGSPPLYPRASTVGGTSPWSRRCATSPRAALGSCHASSPSSTTRSSSRA